MKTKSTTTGRRGFGIASRIKALVAVTLALVGSLATSAALKWTGKYSSNWNTTEYNFVNESGNVLGLMPHPERYSDKLLGGDDGAKFWTSVKKWLEGGRR